MPPSYFNSTGGISKGIVNINSAFEKAARLLEQKRTGSQYDKNKRPTQTRIYRKKYVDFSVNSQRDIYKKLRPGATPIWALYLSIHVIKDPIQLVRQFLTKQSCPYSCPLHKPKNFLHITALGWLKIEECLIPAPGPQLPMGGSRWTRRRSSGT